MRILIVLLSIAVGIGRLMITPRLNLPTTEGSYEAAAHLFVGVLFAAWFMRSSMLHQRYYGLLTRLKMWFVNGSYWSFFAISLTLLEIACFMIQKRGG